MSLQFLTKCPDEGDRERVVAVDTERPDARVLDQTERLIDGLARIVNECVGVGSGHQRPILSISTIRESFGNERDGAAMVT